MITIFLKQGTIEIKMEKEFMFDEKNIRYSGSEELESALEEIGVEFGTFASSDVLSVILDGKELNVYKRLFKGFPQIMTPKNCTQDFVLTGDWARMFVANILHVWKAVKRSNSPKKKPAKKYGRI